jgi:signal transduction histidine kinase
VSHTCYRVVQESLTNTLRHAGTVPVDVTVQADGSALRIDVVDQGPFVTRSERDFGNGLNGMQERVASLGGTLTVRFPATGGCAVHAAIPVVESTSAGAVAAQQLDVSGEQT